MLQFPFSRNTMKKTERNEGMLYGFIGTGNMGGALAQSCAKAVEPGNIFLSNRNPEKADRKSVV